MPPVEVTTALRASECLGQAALLALPTAHSAADPLLVDPHLRPCRLPSRECAVAAAVSILPVPGQVVLRDSALDGDDHLGLPLATAATFLRLVHLVIKGTGIQIAAPDQVRFNADEFDGVRVHLGQGIG